MDSPIAESMDNFRRPVILSSGTADYTNNSTVKYINNNILKYTNNSALKQITLSKHCSEPVAVPTIGTWGLAIHG